MLVSTEKQFLFVHIIKAAGMSIEKALMPYDVRSTGKDPATAAKLQGLQRHTWATELRTVLGPELFARLYKFAFVRNPWDYQLSLYHFNLAHPEFPSHARIAKMKDFEEYIMSQPAETAPNGVQRRQIAEDDGTLLVDFVGRFETLARDFSSICARLGIEASLGHVNATEHKPWQQVYTRKMFEQVRERAQVDIETFGYSGDPATYGIAG